ncbi:hypothetical protein QFZ29_003429 [Agromyces albus]|nr:hypothetical protein [Agromyces albus]
MKRNRTIRWSPATYGPQQMTMPRLASLTGREGFRGAFRECLSENHVGDGRPASRGAAIARQAAMSP